MNEELEDEVNKLKVWLSVAVIGLCFIIFMAGICLDNSAVDLNNRLDNEYMNTEQIQTLLKFNTKIINDTVQNDLLLIDAVLYNQERLTVIEEMLYIELE